MCRSSPRLVYRWGTPGASERPRIMLARWPRAQPRRIRCSRPSPRWADRAAAGGTRRPRSGGRGRSAGGAPLTDLPGVGRTTAERARGLGIAHDRRPAGAPPGALRGLRRRRAAGRRADRRRGGHRARAPRRHRGPAHAPAQPAPGARPGPRRQRPHGRGLVQPGAPRPHPARRATSCCCAGASRRPAAARWPCAATRCSAGAASEGVHTQGLVPVYPATERLPAAAHPRAGRPRAAAGARGGRAPAGRRCGRACGSAGAADSLVAVHFPRSREEARLGRRRLVLEELIVLQLGLLAVRRAEERTRAAQPLRPTGERTGPLLAALPFELTAEQRRAHREIALDLARPRPMRRLLQGEVGSGKTVVAALAICQAVEAGAQAALLVPTETLAEQHLRTLDALLAPAGLSPVLLTGRVPRAERERRLLALSTGTAPVAVGTQALLSEGVGLRPPRAGGRRRAAPLRRRAAPGALRARRGRGRRERRRPPALHDRDADPAHAGPDGLRRPDASRRSAAGRRGGRRSRRAGSATPTARRPTSSCAPSCGPATRRT